MYTTEGKIKEPNLAADIGQGLMGMVSSYAKKDMGGLLKGGMGIIRAAGGGAQKAGEYTKKTRTSPADVVSTRFSDNKTLNYLSSVVDLVERLQRFSNQCRYGGSWTGYGRYEPRELPFFSHVSLVTSLSHAPEHQAFITVLSQNKNLSYQQLLIGIRDILKSKYSQKPQLASSHPIVRRSVCHSFGINE